MFISSKTCLFALVLTAVSCTNAKVELPEDDHPVLRGNSRMLSLQSFDGNQDTLAVLSGTALVFTHPATDIVSGNVCAQISLTGLPSTETANLDYDVKVGDAFLGGCGPSPYLVDFLSAAMAKKAKPIIGEMGGKTFLAGTYFSSALTVAANTVVTLDGGPSDFFLFQSGSYLTTGANTNIVLTGGVTAKNVLFATTAAATTGAAGSLGGSILAGAAITLGANSDVSGYILANAAITVAAGSFINSASLLTSPIAEAIEKAKCSVGTTAYSTGSLAVCI
jgi:hypothetical protein